MHKQSCCYLPEIKYRQIIGILRCCQRGCRCGAGITYLYGGGLKEIANTITNTLANISGIICDGAKPSCAAKIASSVDAAIIASMMSLKGKVFSPGEGIVKENVEKQ